MREIFIVVEEINQGNPDEPNWVHRSDSAFVSLHDADMRMEEIQKQPGKRAILQTTILYDDSLCMDEED